jgi:hypothetical protein
MSWLAQIQDSIVQDSRMPVMDGRSPVHNLQKTSIRRYSNYREQDPTELARLSYGDLEPLNQYQSPEPADFYMPELMTGSDYCHSGSVEVSNHRVFLEQYGKLPNVYDVYGGYGTFAVAIRLDSITEEMREDFARLENYPLLDEDDHSEVERKAEDEAWEGSYRHDFIRDLTTKFPALEEQIDTMTAEQIDSLFRALMERTNTYWQNECGNSAYVDLDRVIAGATEQDISA